jgi:ADP-dependent phosphofructokinase/glucokinase
MTVRMQAMATEWEQMRTLRGPRGEQHMIHVEFGHFSNLESFKVFEKYAVRNADSLGMNELEMKMLLDYWKGDLHNINEKSDSTPTLEDVLK